jgi:hypothetical protein
MLTHAIGKRKKMRLGSEHHQMVIRPTWGHHHGSYLSYSSNFSHVEPSAERHGSLAKVIALINQPNGWRILDPLR